MRTTGTANPASANKSTYQRQQGSSHRLEEKKHGTDSGACSRPAGNPPSSHRVLFSTGENSHHTTDEDEKDATDTQQQV